VLKPRWCLNPAYTVNTREDANTYMSQPMLTEVDDLVTSLQRSTEVNYNHLLSVLKNAEKRQDKLEEQMSMLVSVIAINPTLRKKVIRDIGTGEFTKTVMCKVPITLLMILWKTYRPSQPFPTSEDYTITKVCRSISDDYEVNVRRELGSVFSQVIKSGD
jgi:hypothetical protein